MQLLHRAIRSNRYAGYALFAPAKTPPEIVARLNQVASNIIRSPDIRERLLQQGAEPAGGPPEELDKLVRDGIAKWGAVVRKLGLTAERDSGNNDVE